MSVKARLRSWFTPRRLALLAGELLLILVLMLGLEWYLTRDAARGPAPPIETALLDGSHLDLADYRGQPVLVYFWATWCPVCSVQQGSIDALADNYPVVTVAMQSGNEVEVGEYLADEGLAWPTVADEHGQLARRWGVVGVPAAFVIDSRGEIDFVTRGYTTGIGLRLRLWLASLG